MYINNSFLINCYILESDTSTHAYTCVYIYRYMCVLEVRERYVIKFFYVGIKMLLLVI